MGVKLEKWVKEMEEIPSLSEFPNSELSQKRYNRYISLTEKGILFLEHFIDLLYEVFNSYSEIVIEDLQEYWKIILDKTSITDDPSKMTKDNLRNIISFLESKGIVSWIYLYYQELFLSEKTREFYMFSYEYMNDPRSNAKIVHKILLENKEYEECRPSIRIIEKMLDSNSNYSYYLIWTIAHFNYTISKIIGNRKERFALFSLFHNLIYIDHSNSLVVFENDDMAYPHYEVKKFDSELLIDLYKSYYFYEIESSDYSQDTFSSRSWDFTACEDFPIIKDWILHNPKLIKKIFKYFKTKIKERRRYSINYEDSDEFERLDFEIPFQFESIRSINRDLSFDILINKEGKPLIFRVYPFLGYPTYENPLIVP